MKGYDEQEPPEQAVADRTGGAWERALETVQRCLAQGITEFVICAGARNAALVEVLVQAERAGRVTLRSHFEERAAAFFALGRTMHGPPCAVVTTSGTAVAELLPATIEACYQGRPLVLITADRPARFRHSGAPQCIVQPGIFGPYAFSGALDEWDRRSPYHWNVELEERFEPQPWSDPGEGATQVVRLAGWPRLAVGELAQWLRTDRHRGLVLMLGELEPEDREPVFHLVHDLKVPVVAEATSGLREALAPWVLIDPDRQLQARPPGKILRLGAVPSGRFWRDLEDLPSIDVWQICRSGWPGLARSSRLIEAPLGAAIRALGEVEEVGDALDLLVDNARRAAALDERLEAYPDSEPGMVRTLSRYAALGQSVYLGNSLPIREWNRYAQRDHPVPEVRANRGANGIDGQVSTWLGWTASRRDAWAVVGDLTALYDLAAPAMLRQVERRGRVLVVIHNGGGQIFSRVSRLTALSPRAREVMENPHALTLEPWAAMWAMAYQRIETQDDFDRLVPGETPLLVELRPDAAETRRYLEAESGPAA